MIRVILTLSSILSCLLFWSVNDTSTEVNYVLTVFIVINEWGEILISLNELFAWHKSK